MGRNRVDGYRNLFDALMAVGSGGALEWRGIISYNAFSLLWVLVVEFNFGMVFDVGINL